MSEDSKEIGGAPAQESSGGQSLAKSHPLDTADRFHMSVSTPAYEKEASIEVFPRKDGSVEIVAAQATRKSTGKNWRSEMVSMTLQPDQVAALKKNLP